MQRERSIANGSEHYNNFKIADLSHFLIFEDLDPSISVKLHIIFHHETFSNVRLARWKTVTGELAARPAVTGEPAARPAVNCQPFAKAISQLCHHVGFADSIYFYCGLNESETSVGGQID